jgi:hypothetical protein
MKKRPRFTSIIENDVIMLAAFFFSIIIPACWLVFYRFITLSTHPVEIKLSVDIIIVCVLAVLALAVLVWRLWNIYNIFQKGVEVPAKVTRIQLPKIGFGLIEYEYNYKKTIYTGKSRVIRNFTTLLFEEDKRTRLVVDPEQPKRILMRDLYL